MRENGKRVCSAQLGFNAEIANLMNLYWFCEATGTYIIIKEQHSVSIPCWDQWEFYHSLHDSFLPHHIIGILSNKQTNKN